MKGMKLFALGAALLIAVIAVPIAARAQGMMGPGGMMGGGPGYSPPAAAPSGQQLSRDRARQVVQTWLSQFFPGAKAEHGTARSGTTTGTGRSSGRRT